MTLLREAHPSCNEVFVAEAAALQVAGDPCHLLNGVQAPEVGPASKGGHIAVQVLGTQPVEGAHDPRFSNAQNDSMPLVWAWPLTYSLVLWLTLWWRYLAMPLQAPASSVNT